MKQLLKLVFELIGLALADIFDPRPVVLERPRGELADELVVETVEFKFEEQQIGGGRGYLFLRIAKKLCPLRVCRVFGIDESGIGHDAAQKLFQRLISLDRLKKASAGALPGQAVEFAFVGNVEAPAFKGRFGEIVGEG